MSNCSGLVFNIQRFSIHDGPGIRTTVFLNGCPMRCRWCGNPESNSGRPELFYNPQKCIGCGYCVEACEKNAVNAEIFTKERIDRSICDGCGKCTEGCPTLALSLKGKRMSAQEVIDEVLKDKLFYDTSGGGVTFSGGEPFVQHKFLLELVKLAKKNNLNTAIETAGNIAWKYIEPVIPYLDTIFYDFKHPDTEIHRIYTGVGNELICDNLKKLTALNKDIIVRIPLIPGFNSNSDVLEKSASILKEMGAKTVEFLHYHTLGESKFDFLGKSYNYTTDDGERMERAQLALSIFEKTGIKTILNE
ncbi:MAG TPA: glycyl-radical enzyme activating protein [Clostridiaceae bacterium]|jgi:pyruvate formate lyase activating enzyme|nr:glycyl-radical enzyme activating protein [Clostridiaceae bacterium]